MESSAEIKKLFDAIYCVKSHLLERVVDISENEDFGGFKIVFNKQLRITELAVQAIDWYFIQLSVSSDFSECLGIIQTIEQLFECVSETFGQNEPCRAHCKNYLNQLAWIEHQAYKKLGRLRSGGDIKIFEQYPLLFSEDAQQLSSLYNGYYYNL